MSKTSKIIWTIIAIVVIIIVAMSVKNADGDKIKIGGVFSVTGNGAAYGEPAKNAVAIAVDEINKNGGINGKKVEGLIEDSQFDAKIGLSGYQSLKARGVRFFLTNASGVALAIRKPVVDNNDLQIEVGAVTPLYKDSKPNTCRLALTAPVSGQKLGEFIAKDLKAKTFAALTLNDEYGTAMTETLSKVVTDNGVTVVGKDSFDKNSGDFKTQITKLAALKPDVLLVVPAAGQAQAIFNQLKELNWKGTIVSDMLTIINTNLKDLNVVEGLYFVNSDWTNKINQTDSESTKNFKIAYKNKYNVDPPVIAGNAYDAFSLAALGISKTGSNDPIIVSKWLTNNIKNYQGVSGSISFDQDCESIRTAKIQQVKDGKFVDVQ